jgi:hypothetical protein
MYTIPNLPDTLAREVYAGLCAQLPPPAIDTPEARAIRDDLAMAAVAALLPENAFEAELAVQIVSANAHAKDCFRSIHQPGMALADQRRCRAQASTMMRDAQSGVRTLLRIQAVREKAETAMHPGAMERAGWWFRDASVPLPEPAPAAAEAPQPEPVAAPPEPEQDDDAFSKVSEEEQYALIYPDRAALIRAHGGLPPRVSFGPPGRELVDLIVKSSSPILRALDDHKGGAAA